MKILLINNLYKPYAVGGAEKVVEARAKEYLKQRKEVIIITSAPKNSENFLRPQISNEEGIKIYRFYPLNLCWYKDLNKHGFVFKLLWHVVDVFGRHSARVIKKIIEDEKPSEIELHNLMGIGMYKNTKTQKHKNTVILYLHDVQLVEPSGVLLWNHEKDNWGQKIYSWIMKRKLGGPDLIISPSEFLQKFYQSRGFFRNSEFKIQNAECRQFPLYQEGQTRPPSQAGVRGVLVGVGEHTRRPTAVHPSHRGDTSCKFLFVGSLVEHKGIRVLMQAWNGVVGATLHIVGAGVLEHEVKQWAKDKLEVIIHGRLEGADLDQVYEQCQVLIFPSTCLENRPNVILEALDRGLEVIASDTGGVAEIVGKGSLVEPNNVDELRAKIDSYIAKLLNC